MYVTMVAYMHRCSVVFVASQRAKKDIHSFIARECNWPRFSRETNTLHIYFLMKKGKRENLGLEDLLDLESFMLTRQVEDRHLR